MGKRDDSIEDLRKHLLKKGEQKNRDYDRRDRDGRSSREDREPERGRERDRKKEIESKERYDRSRSEYERYVESTKEAKESSYEEYKRKINREKYKDLTLDVES